MASVSSAPTTSLPLGVITLQRSHHAVRKPKLAHRERPPCHFLRGTKAPATGQHRVPDIRVTEPPDNPS